MGWEFAAGYPNKCPDMVQDCTNLYQYGRDKVLHLCDRVLIYRKTAHYTT